MKKGILFFSFIAFALHSFSQTPGIKWTNYYHSPTGNNLAEVFFDAKVTSKNDFILAGSDTSYPYNKGEFLKKYIQGRPWLVKTDKDGNVLWRISSLDVDPGTSSFTAEQIDGNGEITAVGYGSVNPQPDKFYIAKYDSDGIQLWHKSYGGVTGISRATCIQTTTDGGSIVGGITTSNDGDVSGNHGAGTEDVWILKLDVNGNIQWKKCYGGTG
ncbi:MAG: hypothetical protein ACRDE5_13935, partial [Ginsengibacter sp.]